MAGQWQLLYTAAAVEKDVERLIRLRLRLLFIDAFGMTPTRKLDFQQLTSRKRGLKLNIESKKINSKQ